MASKDYYNVLGCEKTASADDLKKAYRQLSKKYHPDLQSGKSDAEKKEAEERFKEINEAYSVLSDPEKRQHYDNFGTAEGGGPNFGGFDPFERFARHFGGFGGDFGDFSQRVKKPNLDPNQPEDGANFQAILNLTFKEAIFGCRKEFDYNAQTPCPDCGGTGIEHGTKLEICPDCQGSGFIVKRNQTPFGMQIMQTSCHACGGTGVKRTPCRACGGSKRVQTRRSIEVIVPPGIDDGMKLRVPGKGQCGVCGGKDGNIYFIVQVAKSKVFEREGDQIVVEVPVDPLTATLGGEIDIPTLRGSKRATIPAGSQTGKTIRLAGEGVNNGALHAVLRVQPLVNLSSDQKKKVNELLKTLKTENTSGASEFQQSVEEFRSEKC